MREDIYILLNEIDNHTEAFESSPIQEEEIKRWKQAVSAKIQAHSAAGSARIKKDFPAANHTPAEEDSTAVDSARTRKLSWKHYAAAAAVLVFLAGAFCTPIRQRVYAESQKLLYNLVIFLGITGDISSYQTVVEQSFTKDGITVVLHDVIWDDDTLLVSYTAFLGDDADPALNEDNFDIHPQIRMNGEVLSRGSGGSVHHSMGKPSFNSRYTFDIPSATSLSGAQKMELVFYMDNPEASSSSFPIRLGSLEFTVSPDALRADTKNVALNVPATLPDGTLITFQSYAGNPISQKVKYVTEGRAHDLNYTIILKGKDNLGNMVELYTTHYEYDDNGNGKGEMVNDSYIDTYTIATEASSITLTPYAANNSVLYSDTGYMSEEDIFYPIGDSFTISLR